MDVTCACWARHSFSNLGIRLDTTTLISCSHFFFLKIYSFILQRARASAAGRGKGTESQADSALSVEPDVRFDPTTEIMTWVETKSWMFSWLCHPGTPVHIDFSGVLVYHKNIQKFSFPKIAHQKNVVWCNIMLELTTLSSLWAVHNRHPSGCISFEN